MKVLVPQQTLFQVIGVKDEQDIQGSNSQLSISHHDMYFEVILTMKLIKLILRRYLVYLQEGPL